MTNNLHNAFQSFLGKYLLGVIILVCISPFVAKGQTVGVVINDDGTGLGTESIDVLAWSSDIDNQFWGGVFSAKYGLGTDLDLKGIVNPILEAVGSSWRYEIREELYDYSNEVVQVMKSMGLIETDPFLDDYLYQQLQKVIPGPLPPGRSGNLKIYILADAYPKASALPDGTIILNAGLLSRLRTAEELQAIIAHEVAHIILDHSVERSVEILQIAIEQEKKARRRATAIGVFSALAAGVATFAGGKDFVESAAVAGYTGIVAGTIASGYALERAKIAITEAGAMFSRKQEFEADRIAVAWLKKMGLDPVVLISALKRVDYLGRNSPSVSDMRHYATFPSFSERAVQIMNYGIEARDSLGSTDLGGTSTALSPKEIIQIDSVMAITDEYYDFSMSPLLVLTAQIAADIYQDYISSTVLVGRLLQTKAPPASAYILAAKSTRHLGSDQTHNEISLEHITSARQVSRIKTWDLLIEEALIFRRMGDLEASRAALEELLALEVEKRPFHENWISAQIEMSR
jgi:Zn-dependent protease with chaperone function